MCRRVSARASWLASSSSYASRWRGRRLGGKIGRATRPVGGCAALRQTTARHAGTDNVGSCHSVSWGRRSRAASMLRARSFAAGDRRSADRPARRAAAGRTPPAPRCGRDAPSAAGRHTIRCGSRDEALSAPSGRARTEIVAARHERTPAGASRCRRSTRSGRGGAALLAPSGRWRPTVTSTVTMPSSRHCPRAWAGRCGR
jgi:hypothetical protein